MRKRVKLESKSINTMNEMNEKDKNIQNFRATDENTMLLNTICITKTKYINNAIFFYNQMLTNPKKILIELKKRNPELFKYVNRRRFI